ncbi:helix-turn-helix domain-containing protein [Alteromonas flava]|uniref:helix-turn-helix domain-containing protein n=1 Tax=Alteromonas flava TaxID=2048003 RepID=UPI000C28BAA2|nr:AraC family transcriptional regulator [Alteromonas flava]
MTVEIALFALLMCSLSLMLAQLTVKQKQLEHILFAVFCGSLSIVAVKQLSADTLGHYQYLLGVGTCATCNAMWLIARSMFHGEKSIKPVHIGVAAVISGLVIISQLNRFIGAETLISETTQSTIASLVSDTTQLLSSTILMLTFWEAVRKSKADYFANWQRYLFAAVFLSSVLLCSVVFNAVVPVSQSATLFPFFMVVAATQIMLATQMMLLWKRKAISAEAAPAMTHHADTVNDDQILGERIVQLMEKDKMYLQHQLKIIDIAKHLQVSEYRVSRAIRGALAIKNFNQLVNQYRIEYAKHLLASPTAEQWPIIVISMESGFASVASFNRAFKSITGDSPLAYKQSITQNTLNSAS